MKNNMTYYAVKGTGTSLDGSIVSIVENGENDYVFVLPYGRMDGKYMVKPISIHSNCLQELKETAKYSYYFTVSKYDENDIEINRESIHISDSFKNVDCRALIDFIIMNIKPLLELKE